MKARTLTLIVLGTTLAVILLVGVLPIYAATGFSFRWDEKSTYLGFTNKSGSVFPSQEQKWHTFSEASMGISFEYESPLWVLTLLADNGKNTPDGVSQRVLGLVNQDEHAIIVLASFNNLERLNVGSWAKKYDYQRTAITPSYQTKIIGPYQYLIIKEIADEYMGTPNNIRAIIAINDNVYLIEYASLSTDENFFEDFLSRINFFPQNTFVPSSLKDTLIDSFTDNNVELLPSKSNEILGVQVSTCCGITDHEWNPFPCNTAQNHGNCTWWVRYRRTGNNVANLYACTGNANTWDDCAAQNYPNLIRNTPAQYDAVVWTAPGDNHVTFIEWMNTGTSYHFSQMDWYGACPQHYYDSSRTNNRVFIRHPDKTSSTCPAPLLLSPGDGETVHERHVRLDWAAPQCSGLRGYTLHITTGSEPEDGIIKDTGVGPDEYTYDFPHDGTFYWHVAAWSGDNRGPWASRRIVIDTSQPPPSNCSINADQIALFMDDDYRGRCVVKNVGEYPNPGAIGLPNDSISSVKVGSNVKAVLCKHDGFNDCETFERDDNHLGDNHIGNDQVSSVKVERRVSSCTINTDQVALFEHDNFRGRCVVKGIGDYPNPSAMGFPNDTASSIRIGSNVKAVLCKHDGFNDCETFEHDDSHLGDNHIGNDQLSSLKVQRRTQSSPAKPRMKSPQDGATISQGADVVLDWDPSSNATEYAAEYKGPDGRIHNSGHQSATEWNIGRLSPGTYHWHVEAYNQGGSQWSGWTTEWSFRVLPPAPSANFDAQPLNGQAPLTVRFHIITTDNMSSCTWHYGDGQTGHSCDPYHEHTYTRAGRYTVRLDVSGPGGSNSKTRTNYISVSSNSVTSTPTPTPTRTRRPISPTATATPTPTPTTRPSVGDLRFSGRVIDYNGRPLSKFGYIQVWGSNLSDGSDTERWLANLTTDNNGNFSWTAPANHRYRYYFLHPHPINDWTSYKVIGVIPGSRGEIWREEWIRYPIVKLGNGSYDGNIFTLSQNGRRATATPTPTATPSIPTEAWLGEYFDNASLQGRPKLVRSDKNINFDWKESSPAPGLPPDHFSVRWVRRIDFSAGNYTFTIGRDDGARLWIDGQLILDEWKQGREEHTVQKELSEGEHILRFEMYEHEGWAMAKLTWRTGDTTPPSGNFTEPASNAEVSAPVWLRANVHDDPSGSGIDYVKFTSNGTGRWREIARDRTPPYEVRWDMAGVPNGRKFMIGMEIYDKAGNRTNRIRWITKQEVSVSPDIYEPDNDANAAKWISVNGYPGRHNFHVRHDEDWVKFVLSPGTYVMETFELSPSVDTVIELYKSGHVEPIASNDDSNGLASRIVHTVGSSGIYLIRIRSYSTGHTGENSFYRIHVIPSSISDQNSEDNDGKTKDTR